MCDPRLTGGLSPRPFFRGLTAFCPLLFVGGLLSTAVLPATAEPPIETAGLVARGDIRRDRAPAKDRPWLPLYQGNGRIGCCFGPWGLHAGPEDQRAYPLRGVSHFTHLGHVVRAKHNADYLLPVASIHWGHEPREVRDYAQHQSFHDGTILTRFRTAEGTVEVLSWIDPVRRHLVGFQIDVQGRCPPIIIAPLRRLSVHYNQQMEQDFEGEMKAGTWHAEIRCLTARTTLTVQSTAEPSAVPEGLRLSLSPGRHEVLVAIGGAIEGSVQDSLRATRTWWHSAWESGAWLDLPDEAAQKVWIRSMAYVLSSHNDDGIGCSPPNGLTGAGWPFPFPFDSGCRQPLLLWTGQIDAARRWVEFWSSRREGLRQYTRRIWKIDGIMLPHVFPYGPAEDFHLPEPPNENYYPIYNAGHMSRIAHQTAIMVNDPAWTKQHALPLIEGAARFYLSMARKGQDGLWHFSIVPSLGLDESGGLNQPDYLCTLVSAEYAFRRAIEHGLDRDGRMAGMLQDGLAYKALLSKEGLYYSNIGSGARDFGRQKHPDQLAALVHLPLGGEPDGPTRRSYELRYEITAGANEPRFIGHTLGEFILASARMHDPAGWRKDWEQVQPARYADPEWIQFYESSGNGLVYYVTTHGMFAQAILETVVSTWWERLDLAPCIPWAGRVRFGNIRTLAGVTVSGEVVDGRGQATLRAWKQTAFPCRGQTFSMQTGDVVTVPIEPDGP
ncbi:MAG: hypothetical protein AMXMBFR13_20970 [Phycisphaerae bacterium]